MRYVEIWPHRRPHLQLRRHLLGLRAQHAPEALPTHATRQPRGTIRNHPSYAAASTQEWQDRGCEPAHLQSLLQGQDGVCDGQGGDECAHQGSCHGFRKGGEERHGHYEYLACSGMFSLRWIERNYMANYQRASSPLRRSSLPVQTQMNFWTYAKQQSSPTPSSLFLKPLPLWSTANFSWTKTSSATTAASQTFPNTTSSPAQTHDACSHRNFPI